MTNTLLPAWKCYYRFFVPLCKTEVGHAISIANAAVNFLIVLVHLLRLKVRLATMQTGARADD